MENKILEICCFNIDSVKIASQSGADRIELCIEPELDGITPTEELVHEAVEESLIPIFTMIRPRGGNFIYSVREINQMQRTIVKFKSLGAKGFVFGCLTEKNEVDLGILRELLSVTDNLPVTFHRAFDHITDKEKAISELASLEINRILTSGNPGKALDNLSKIRQLVDYSNNTPKIMVCGSIRSTNLFQIMNETKANEFHSSAITNPPTFTADHKEIQKMLSIIKN